MKTIKTQSEFLAMFDAAGRPTKPFALGEGCVLYGLTGNALKQYKEIKK